MTTDNKRSIAKKAIQSSGPVGGLSAVGITVCNFVLSPEQVQLASPIVPIVAATIVAIAEYFWLVLGLQTSSQLKTKSAAENTDAALIKAEQSLEASIEIAKQKGRPQAFIDQLEGRLLQIQLARAKAPLIQIDSV